MTDHFAILSIGAVGYPTKHFASGRVKASTEAKAQTLMLERVRTHRYYKELEALGAKQLVLEINYAPTWEIMLQKADELNSNADQG